MSYSLCRTDDEPVLFALHTLIFRWDEWEPTDAGWVAYDDLGSAVGFCTARKLKAENGVFLARAGVLPCAEGKGLQRRMIRVRERWAKSQDADYILTYCLFSNHASLVNLIKAGYRLYSPSHKWAGDVHYFQKEL